MVQNTLINEAYVPTETISAEYLSKAVEGLAWGDSSCEEVLRRGTSTIQMDQIPWSDLRYLEIIGRANEYFNYYMLNDREFQATAHISHSGDWLLILHPEDYRIHQYLECCREQLDSLRIYYSALPALDISPLTKLSKLLIFDDKELSTLSGLDKLTCLTELDVNGCQNLTSLTGLDKLFQLKRLFLKSTPIPALPDLSTLSRLERMVLSDVPMDTIPAGVRNLKSLKSLSLESLHLQDLPVWFPEIAERFTTEQNNAQGNTKAIVSLWDTEVASLEMSLFSQSYETIAQWFSERKQALNEIKVVFLGDGAAGKTHTIARLLNGGKRLKKFDGKVTPGISISNCIYDLVDRQIQVHFWDFGGQEILHSMHHFFLTNRTLYVVMLNAREDTQNQRAQYWLQTISSFAPNAPVLIALNQIDQNPKAYLDERSLRSKYPSLTQTVRLSAKCFSQKDFNQEFRDVLLNEIRRTGYLDVQWPVSWMNIKQRLARMDGNYIFGDEYEDICKDCLLNQNQEELLHWFNDLGVSFCFKGKKEKALHDYVILRPEWITNALYIILFNEYEGLKNGLISHNAIYELLGRAGKDSAIQCVLPKAKYRDIDIQYVLGLMREFGFSFRYGDEHEFIPMLCQPEATLDISKYHEDPETLEFTMEFDYLPTHLLHLLMVRRPTELDIHNVWRTGARFHQPDLRLRAVVTIDGNMLRFFVRHADSMHRPNTYLAVLKSHVDQIWKETGLLQPKNTVIYKKDSHREEFDYEFLKEMLDAGEKLTYSRRWKRMIPIEEILNQFAPEGIADEKKLLEAIRQSCRKIQDEPIYRLIANENGRGYANGQDMEDRRNRRVRDDLLTLGYKVADQSQRGTSKTGTSIGELDMLVFNENNESWTIIEALRVSNGTKADWNKHLNKLIGNYNSRGLSFLYLLTYVDADPKAFDRIYKGYQKHIQGYSPQPFAYCEKSYVDLNNTNSPRYVKTVKCQYACGSEPITVYHILHGFPRRTNNTPKPDGPGHPAFSWEKLLNFRFFYARINCQVMRICVFYNAMKTKEF